LRICFAMVERHVMQNVRFSVIFAYERKEDQTDIDGGQVVCEMYHDITQCVTDTLRYHAVCDGHTAVCDRHSEITWL